jgi:hypothetical protein
MERFEEILGKDKKVYRQATIVKDRSTIIDGKTFVNPTFKDFEPAIDEMLAAPEEREIQETDSTGLFKTEEDKRDYIRNKEIVLEKITNELVKAYPSSGAADKKKRIEMCEKVFNTNSWEEIKRKGLAELTPGLERLKTAIIDYFADQFPDKAKEKKTSLKKTVKARKGGKDVK